MRDNNPRTETEWIDLIEYCKTPASVDFVRTAATMRGQMTPVIEMVLHRRRIETEADQEQEWRAFYPEVWRI